MNVVTTTDSAYDQLLVRIQKRETAARRRTALISIVPIIIAAVVLGVMVRTIMELESQVRTLEKLLLETTDLARFRHPVDLTDLKSIASQYPEPARALDLIFQLREHNVRWHLGGQSPEQGFDSPSFAAYIVSRLRPDVLPGFSATSDLVTASHTLKSSLPPTSHPGVGDLAFYPSGYALFRFVDRHGQPFVIGMTPQGIVALEPNFSQSIGAAHIPW